MAKHPLESDVLSDPQWQMHFGERYALDGLLRDLQPALSVEIGRAEGGSLRRIAAHSGHVHSFDLVEPPEALRTSLGNVDFHTGDSTVQVPETLAALAERGEHVDFALVDGDHSPEGVKRDAEALLASPACETTVIVFHDAANDDVRAGLEAVDFAEHDKVALVMLDFVAGFLVEHGPYRGHIWNGLGLVILGPAPNGEPLVERDRFDAAMVARAGRDALMSAPAPAEPPPAEAAPAGPGRARTAGVAAAGLLLGAAAGAVAGRAVKR